ncbi:MAG TPA: phospholipase [Chloroflexia bacterium]|nr:phospholipase [Chloroflexia bacterium]
MRQSTGSTLLALRCSLYLGLLGLLAALVSACTSEGTAGQATPGQATQATGPAPTTPADNDGQAAKSPTTEQPAPTHTPAPPVSANPDEGELAVRPLPSPHATAVAQTGLQPLGIGRQRDGLIYVPAGYRAYRPAALVLLLHGAGGNARHGISLLQPLADSANLILIAPDSRGSTWDVIMSDYGPDVTYIEQALSQTFSRYAIDPKRVAVGGFSDGASYALSLGITNGELFTHIIAFSPGFMAPTRQQGKPKIYDSHGIHDQVLPIARCSRRIVPQLQRLGYEVKYHEFDGPHTVPPDIAQEAVDWFTR